MNRILTTQHLKWVFLQARDQKYKLEARACFTWNDTELLIVESIPLGIWRVKLMYLIVTLLFNFTVKEQLNRAPTSAPL